VASHLYRVHLSEVTSLRRVSPEAASFAKASEDIPRSFNEGELA